MVKDIADHSLGKMLDKGHVWFAPLRDIAAHVRQCMANGSWTPRTELPLRMPRTFDPPQDAPP